MRNLTATLCLTIAVLLGSAGVSESADLQKGLTAARNGDMATALREWKPLAEQGNARAQYFIGMAYAMGKGVPQDDKTAVKWFRLSVEQGYSNAQNYLGQMYYKGRGVTQNSKTALKWFRLAAKQGNPKAKNNVKLLEKLVSENPEGILESRYRQYMTIKECHKQSSMYINSRQMKTAKSKIRSIQDYLKRKNKKMDTDAIWESASEKWDKEMAGSFKMLSMTGQYSKDVNGICKVQLMDLSSANIPGAKKKAKKKDF